MKYLLDTDHISFLLRRSGPGYAALTSRIAQHSPADFSFSIASFHEQTLGGHAFLSHARMASHLIRGYDLLMNILQTYMTMPVLPFDAAVETVFSGLIAQKIRVGTMDLRIAAIALSRGLTLLTRNQRDFGKVPGLLTEDWTV